VTSPFIAPRYEVPLVDKNTGRIGLEWYKFLVPLAKKAVSSEISINTTAPLTGGADLTMDVTLSIQANGVTNAFLAQMAADTFKGNATGAGATPQDMTATQATALLNVFTDTLKGLVPLSGGTNNNLLRSDGTWTNAVDGSLTAGTFLKTGSAIVSGLPSAATAGLGARYIVTDATVTTFASIVAGTGGNTVPVYSDGTNWRIG
jgi:hypothetical protein